MFVQNDEIAVPVVVLSNCWVSKEILTGKRFRERSRLYKIRIRLLVYLDLNESSFLLDQVDISALQGKI